jgi:hypothetical protein
MSCSKENADQQLSLNLLQGRIKPRAQVGFLGLRVYRPLTRRSGGGNFFC